MADEALRKLAEQLTCSICLDTYCSPKLLQCNHVFCQGCLVRLVVRDQQGQLSLSCPSCRHNTPVPASGVRGLPAAFHINHLLEIQASFREIGKSSADQVEGVCSSSGTSPGSNVDSCLEHEDKAIELYCRTCEELICLKCAIKGGRHHSHEYDEINVAFERYREEILTSLKPMEKHLSSVHLSLDKLDECCSEICEQRAGIEASIHRSIDQIQEALNVRRTELVARLHRITQGKLESLAVQREQIETTQAQLCSCLDIAKESLTAASQSQVLKMSSMLVKQVKDLTSSFQPDSLKPSTEADVSFVTLSDAAKVCQSYGVVSAPGLADSSRCFIMNPNIEEDTMVGKSYSATMQALNFRGEPCKEVVESLECELVSEVTGTRVRGSTQRIGQSCYEVSYQPTIKGQHQLYVTIEGHDIIGSPFKIAAKSLDHNLGNPFLTLDDVVRPWGVAVTLTGEIVVTEYDGHCVSIFTPSGKKRRWFGKEGSGQGQLKHPCGVAMDSKGNIFVCGSHNHRVQKFTPDGQLLAYTKTKLSFPLGLAFNFTNNKLYVAGGNSHTVLIFSSDLQLSQTFGREGDGKGEFRSPWDVACDDAGRVYVADSCNHRIQVFTAKGKYLRVFWRCGSKERELCRPVGIAVSSVSGMVYVSETLNRICVFTLEGQFLSVYEGKGEGPQKLNDPRGLAVDDYGIVYVCDRDNCLVQIL